MNFKKVVFSTLFLSFVFLFGIKVASADSININLRQGSHSGEVSKLQQFLIDEGYLTTAVTGTFGPKTALAVRAFQRDNGISQTGAIGPLTRGRINGPDFLGFCNGVTTPKIKVKKPNGGETYTVGGQINVKWRTCNAPANYNVLVTLLNSVDNVSGVRLTSPYTPNDKKESFVIPASIVPGTYKIHLQLHDILDESGSPLNYDTSDQSFTISVQQSNSWNHTTINGVSIPYPSTWQIQNPDRTSCDPDQRVMCVTTLGGRGNLSYKIYDPSLTTGAQTNDPNAIYISPMNCSSTMFSCPLIAMPSVTPTAQAYSVGSCMTIQTSGLNSSVTSIYNQITAQVSSTSNTNSGCLDQG
jgi:peptidoglycan hydrolase-like protein with peptidoglycan-binding domain